MPDFVDPFLDWPCQPPNGYLGQLTQDFQRRRADYYSNVVPDQCTWYHTTDLPDGRVMQGEWDLRGRELGYLGGVAFESLRVLEIGPASGYLTYWMEAQGALVTAFEVGYDARINMLPSPAGGDTMAAEAELIQHTRRTANAWWYLHHMLGSSARLVHGDIYSLPADLGRYDVASLAFVLVHTASPFRVLEQVVQYADSVIVTEQVDPAMRNDDSLMRFAPALDNPGPTAMWWHFSPGAIVTMLWRLGFGDSRVSFHEQRHHVPDSTTDSTVELPCFTVYAQRQSRPAPEGVTEPSALADQIAATDEELARLRSRVAALCGDQRRLTELAEELERLRETATFRWTLPFRNLYSRVRRWR
jgi:hypothetical protein